VAVSVEPRASVENRAFCATVSTASDEPLAATASRIDNWIVLEYRALWDRNVLGASRFTPELKAHLREQLHALAPSRLLFVKKPERRAYERRHVYFGSSEAGEERFYQLEVDHQEDLLGFDFAGALAGDGRPGIPVDHPLMVVCTHGKRDRCCAKNGRPLYDALRHETESSWVWQSTHVGGDRFAGNVVMLPQALYYGRVEPGDVPALLEAHMSGRIEMEHYRGRAAYTFPVQAAEHAIRESEGFVGIGDLEHVGTDTLDEGWRVRFRTKTAAVIEADVVSELSDEAVHLTCCAAEPQRACHYTATALRRL
jgi:hypothetical protein